MEDSTPPPVYYVTKGSRPSPQKNPDILYHAQPHTFIAKLATDLLKRTLSRESTCCALATAPARRMKIHIYFTMHNFTRPAYPCLQDGRLFLTFRRKVLPRELDISYTCLSHDNTRKCSLGTTLSLRTQPAFLRRLPCSREIDTSCIRLSSFQNCAFWFAGNRSVVSSPSKGARTSHRHQHPPNGRRSIQTFAPGSAQLEAS